MEGQYIFIVGCARSGTTLLRQILSMSDRVSIAPETHFLRQFGSVGKGRLQHWGDLADDANLERMIDFMYSGRANVGSVYWGWLLKNVDRQTFRQVLCASDRTERGIFEALIKVYADKTLPKTVQDPILGEKTPSHFNYIPTLLEWFPQAHIIHTFRDPRAILLSELKKMRKKGREGPKRLFRSAPAWMLEPLELPYELVHTTRSWLDAARWHAVCQERYPSKYTLVRFEDLVTEPQREIKRLCEFVGLPFEEKMVTEVRVVGSSYQNQHKGAAGFDKTAADRWKSNLHPALGLWFSLLGGKQLKKFGYA